MRQPSGKFTERRKAIALLLDASRLADPVRHQSDQAGRQLRHPLYEFRKLSGGKTQQSAIADRPSGHRSLFHSREGKKARYFAGLHGKGKRLSVEFTSHLKFPFQHHEHALRSITLANVCVAWFQELLLALTDEPRDLVLRNIGEHRHAK